jgi:cytochrome c556
MIANYESIIQERMQQMENERIKLAQAQEKIEAEKQKQIDTVMLKLTELEQQFGKQLEGEYQQNAEVINGMQ